MCAMAAVDRFAAVCLPPGRQPAALRRRRTASSPTTAAPQRSASRAGGRVYAAASRSGAETLIKVCGVTNPEDAQHAVDQGADFIGMIIWPKAKRSIGTDVATEIVSVARAGGAEPVGVFVDEDAETIVERCGSAGLTTAQLHGDGARSALARLPDTLKVVYVMQADSSGMVQTPAPAGRSVSWIIVDGMQGGSGETFDWNRLEVPTECAEEGWLLAGGLGPDNVAEAIRVARPTGVDVSSGVAGSDGIKKDPAKVTGFVEAIKGALARPTA